MKLPPKLPSLPSLPALSSSISSGIGGARRQTLDQRVNAKKPRDGIERAQMEVTEAQQAFRDQRKAERKRIEAVNDTEFWFCVTSISREQKDWMLRQLGLWDEGDKYLDAEQFWAAMRRMNPKLPPLMRPDFKLGTMKKNRRLSELAFPLPDAD